MMTVLVAGRSGSQEGVERFLRTLPDLEVKTEVQAVARGVEPDLNDLMIFPYVKDGGKRMSREYLQRHPGCAKRMIFIQAEGDTVAELELLRHGVTAEQIVPVPSRVGRELPAVSCRILRCSIQEILGPPPDEPVQPPPIEPWIVMVTGFVARVGTALSPLGLAWIRARLGLPA